MGCTYSFAACFNSMNNKNYKAPVLACGLALVCIHEARRTNILPGTKLEPMFNMIQYVVMTSLQKELQPARNHEKERMLGIHMCSVVYSSRDTDYRVTHKCPRNTSSHHKRNYEADSCAMVAPTPSHARLSGAPCLPGRPAPGLRVVPSRLDGRALLILLFSIWPISVAGSKQNKRSGLLRAALTARSAHKS